MTIWRTRIECRILKGTDTHSEYVILIAFPLQQWLHERASTLSYTRFASLVNCLFKLHFSRWWSCNGNRLSLRTLLPRTFLVSSPHTHSNGNSEVPLQIVLIFFQTIDRYFPALLVFVTKTPCSSVRYNLQSCVQFLVKFIYQIL